MKGKPDDMLNILKEILQEIKNINKNITENSEKKQDIYNDIEILDEITLQGFCTDKQISSASCSRDDDLRFSYSVKKNEHKKQFTLVESEAINETKVDDGGNFESECSYSGVDDKGLSAHTQETGSLTSVSTFRSSLANVIKNSYSESDGAALAAQTRVSEQENESVDSGSSMADFINISYSESDDEALATKENESVDSGSINAIRANDFEHNDEVNHSYSDSKTSGLSKQSEETTSDNMFKDERPIDTSNEFAGGQNHIMVTHMVAESETSIDESRVPDPMTCRRQNNILNYKDNTPVVLPKQMELTENNKAEKSGQCTDLKRSNGGMIAFKLKDKQENDITKPTQTKDSTRDIGVKISNKQAAEFTKEIEVKKNVEIDIKKYDDISMTENPVLSPQIGCLGDTQKCDRLLKSSVLLIINNDLNCHYIARNIGFPLRFDEYITADIFLTWCKYMSENHLNDIQTLQFRVCNNSSELGTNVSFLGIVPNETGSSVGLGGNKIPEDDINEKQTKSPQPIVITRYGRYFFTIFGLDYISKQKHRVKVRVQLESAYCKRIAKCLGLKLSDNNTLSGLLSCFGIMVSGLYERLNYCMTSYRCQVNLLADSNQMMWDRRPIGQSMYAHVVGDGRFSVRNQAQILIRRMFACNEMNGVNQSDYYEIITSSDEYESQPCQELVVHKTKKVSLQTDNMIRNSGQIRSVWNLFYEIYQIYTYVCSLLFSIFAKKVDAVKMRSKIRTQFTQMNVVRAEYFECAMRESARIQVQLTFTHIYTLDNRIPTAVPIYRDGFIDRKDRCR